MASSFQRNMCTLDRVVRILAGAALVYIGFFASHLINNDIINLFLVLLGLINVGAALTAHCPLYSLASISTWKRKPRN